MNYGIIFILFLEIVTASFEDTDYCDASLCEGHKKHIGCDNDGNFVINCIGSQIMRISTNCQNRIVRKHNFLRNEIAKGYGSLPSAKRMSIVLWDDELAMLAELNVKQCRLHHDQCRNTYRFPFVGQNIGLARWRRLNVTACEILNDIINGWFNEYKKCPLDVIKRFRTPTNVYYDHFTNMVQDKSTHFGCAILRNIPYGSFEYIVACNYAHGNVVGEPVYKQGKSAKGCETWINYEYPSLCSSKEYLREKLYRKY